MQQIKGEDLHEEMERRAMIHKIVSYIRCEAFFHQDDLDRIVNLQSETKETLQKMTEDLKSIESNIENMDWTEVLQ